MRSRSGRGHPGERPQRKRACEPGSRHHFCDVEVIIATLDSTIRAGLRASGIGEVAGARLIGATPAEVTEALRRQMAARPEPHEDLLIAKGPDLLEATELVRLGLQQQVPVLIWPTAGTGRPSSAPSPRHSRLTAREREILELVAGGVSNKGIARALRVSPNTVKFHLAALFHKLAVTTRAEAIAAAARSGELSL